MRYIVKRPRQWDVDDSDEGSHPIIHNFTVYDDNDLIQTGVVDLDGNEIYRTDKGPVGFLSEILECSD